MTNTTSAPSVPVLGFADMKELALSHFRSDRPKKRTFYVEGAPGGGKTALGYAVAHAMGFMQEEIMLLRPSIHTPVDYMGIPDTDAETRLTTWCPPDFIHKLTTGEIKFLILDELPDAVQSVQNVLCGLIYDFEVAGLHIHPDLNIFGTGNRVEDRSGANRLVTKMTNRMSMHELAQDVDSWVEWAFEANLPKDLVAYIHWKGAPSLYGESGFDPHAKINATPRQWEEVAYIDQSLPANLFLAQVKSYVPEGEATQYMAFRKTVAELPPISEIESNPEKAPVSDKIDVNYALTSRLIAETDVVAKYQKYMKYITRLPMEVQTLYNTAAQKRVQEVTQTPEYNKWAVKNYQYFKRSA